MSETRIKYNPSDFVGTQKLLGLRPGNKYVDPHYLRRGIGNKAYLWVEDKKWKLLNPGDTIILNGDGSVELEKVKA